LAARKSAYLPQKEETMKRTATCPVLALLIFVAFPVGAAQHDNAAKNSIARHEKSPQKTIHISGTVGSQGKTLVSDRDGRVWMVVNPDILSSSAGRRVTVRAYADIKWSEIKVAVVRLRADRTTAKLDDSAFRR
jgi:hypothetical protein